MDRLRLCMAPVRRNDPEQAAALYHFACQYAARLPVHPPRYEATAAMHNELLSLLMHLL